MQRILLAVLLAGCGTSAGLPATQTAADDVEAAPADTDEATAQPSAQLTRYGDMIRGRIGHRPVEVQVVSEVNDRYRVTGLMGGMPVQLWIDGLSGRFRAHTEIKIAGNSGNKHVAITLTDRKLRGHAGCFEFDLASDDGISYAGSGTSGLMTSLSTVTVPALRTQRAPEFSAATMALMLTSYCLD
jgi:hypothetical protein